MAVGPYNMWNVYGRVFEEAYFKCDRFEYYLATRPK